MALIPFEALQFDWSKALDRKRFESKFNQLKEDKNSESNGQRILGLIQLLVPQFFIILVLYGYVAYTITT